MSLCALHVVSLGSLCSVVSELSQEQQYLTQNEVEPQWNGYFALRGSMEEAAHRGTWHGWDGRSPKSVIMLRLTFSAAGLCSLLDKGLDHKGADWWRFYGALRQELRVGDTVLYRLDKEVFQFQ